MAMTDEIRLLEKQKSSSKDSATWLYLDLMKKGLVNWLYMDQQLTPTADLDRLNRLNQTNETNETNQQPIIQPQISNVQRMKWRLGLIKRGVKNWLSRDQQSTSSDRDQQPTPASSLGRMVWRLGRMVWHLDRMKQSVVYWVYLDQLPTPPEEDQPPTPPEEDQPPKAFDPQIREEGLDWPANAHTMIGLKRLDNIQFCVEDVLTNDIAGDLIETGVWRGGATIFMRAILKVYGEHNRTVWVADSFEGLPPPNPEKYPQDAGDNHYTSEQLAIPIEQVKENFERYGLLDDQVRFLKGWFSQTLPTAPIEKLAVIRLDGDMYESTMDALVSLYPKLSVGGYLIVDDYKNKGTVGCRKAVDDYRELHGITDELVNVDWTAAYWQRS